MYIVDASDTQKPQRCGGETVHGETSLPPPPHAGSHVTLQWDGIPVFNHHLSQVSHSGCVDYLSMNCVPKFVSRVEIDIEVTPASMTLNSPHHRLQRQSSVNPHTVGVTTVFLQDGIHFQTPEV